MDFLIKEQTVKKLFEYLGRRPYFEVESLVSALKELKGVVEKKEKVCPAVEIAENDAGKEKKE